ncbi:hypothetical protein EDB86DRAFT_2946104 [Lactarius hatsudake]|nr:hypothetical protein EDB86DRAFT_2946104 [Lactarius hatsudake]
MKRHEAIQRANRTPGVVCRGCRELSRLLLPCPPVKQSKVGTGLDWLTRIAYGEAVTLRPTTLPHTLKPLPRKRSKQFLRPILSTSLPSVPPFPEFPQHVIVSYQHLASCTLCSNGYLGVHHIFYPYAPTLHSTRGVDTLHITGTMPCQHRNPMRTSQSSRRRGDCAFRDDIDERPIGAPFRCLFQGQAAIRSLPLRFTC